VVASMLGLSGVACVSSRDAAFMNVAEAHPPPACKGLAGRGAERVADAAS
jgi:hypothetical protein